MTTKVKRWGNSLAIRIPHGIATELMLTENSTIDLHAENGRIVVKPSKRPRYRLEDLVAQITPENLHGEWNTGPAVGNEVLD
jgi:antitoxin MazE